MNKFNRNLVVAAIAFSFLSTACQTNEESISSPFKVESEVVKAATENGTIIPGKYIVVFNEGAVDASAFRNVEDYETKTLAMKKAVANAFSKYGITEEKIEHAYSSTISGISLSLDASTVEKLSKDSRVKYIEQDKVVALDKFVSQGSGAALAAEEIPWGITRVNGGQVYTGTKKCYVIDTGIDLTHPDLNVRTSGFNAFKTGKDSKSLTDGNGHGTHCAGTIAAKANGTGVIGVAAGALVVPVKVLGSTGSGSNSGVIAGVDYVGANGAAGDVANMSLGGGVSSTLDNAVLAASNKGIIFCVAAGNEAQHANNSSPARVNGANVFTVSAMDVNNNFASFSNYGNPPVDACEPGVSIKSTWKGGGYNTISGTSMATPHLAGLKLWGGTLRVIGYVNGDKDSSPDPILAR